MISVCKVAGCDAPAFNLCKKHYDQKNHGCGIFRDFSKGRRQYDPNEFRIEGDICYISLYDKQNNKKAEAIIDAEDYEKCKVHRWGVFGPSHALRATSSKVGHLGNFIMNFTPVLYKTCVDHKDGNALDNRKENLQICTIQQNNIKRASKTNSISGYRGVASYKNKWVARVGYNKKGIFLGYFTIKEEAALAYNKKAQELFGDFAVLNHIIEKEVKNAICY